MWRDSRGGRKALLISFLVQNKNYGRYLRQCLNSILTQDIQQDTYEVLGLDAGSTDNSQRIYRELIGNFIDVTGCNQAEALNIALKMAEGEYIGWINSDDYYRANYAKTHLALFNKFRDKNISVTYAERLSSVEIPKGIPSIMIWVRRFPYKVIIMDKRRKWLKDKLVLDFNPISTLRKILRTSRRSPSAVLENTSLLLSRSKAKLDISNFRVSCVHLPAVMFRRDLILQVGGWNEKLTYCIDDDLFLRLAQVGNFVYVPKFTAITRFHGSNMGLRKTYASELEVKAFYEHHKNARLGELFFDS